VIQPGLERARHPRAVVHTHSNTVAPIDPRFDQRTVPRPTLSELHQIESRGIKLSSYNGFQRFVHVVSRCFTRTKKCGEPPPHSARETSSRSDYKLSGSGMICKRADERSYRAARTAT